MAASDKLNILIVDDQPSKLLSLQAILESMGENLIKAGSARQALDILLRQEIAVILVDVCMPELDGFELAQVIREHPRFRRTAIIFISAVHLTDSDRIRGYGLGAVDYIPVPIIPEMLRAKVAVFIDLYRKTGALERVNAELEVRVQQRTAELEASSARLRESEQILNLALDSAGAAPWDWRIAQGKLEWPSRYRRLYGFPADVTPAFETWLDRIHPDDRNRVELRLTSMLRTAGDDLWSEEFRILHPEDGIRWVSGRGRVLRDDTGEAVRLAGIDLDITDRKQAEEDRVRLLESEREARAAAELANRLKDDFLATVSHELRSPINSVQIWIQLARRGKLDSHGLKEALEAIERGVHTQTRLINDLLDLSRITSGKLQIEAAVIDLRTSLRMAIDTIMPLANAKGVTVTMPLDLPEAPIFGDALRLQQIFGNLLDNSVKFTPQGGRIDVDVSVRAGHVAVVVSDNGRGIAREFLPYIFDRFRQADSSITRRHGGLGLGLAIVKHLLELHGGAISAESEGEGKGARFIVRLPLAPTPAGASPAGGKPDEISLATLRVLVVEDDKDTRQVLSRLLADARAEVLAVDSATTALQRFARWQPDILISDISMPDMDGYALMRELRRAGESLPSLALTAFARPEDRMRAIDAGYTMHLAKPVDPQELLTSVRALARRASARALGRPDGTLRPAANGPL